MSHTTPDERNARDELLLHWLCTGGGGFNELLSVAAWGKRGAAVGNVVRRLARETKERPKRVHIEQAVLDGNRNWILPTEAVCSRLGYPKHRASLTGTKALNDRMKLAVFCTLSGIRRWPIEQSQLHQILGRSPNLETEASGERRHVITTEFNSEHPVVMAVVYSVGSLKQQIERAAARVPEMLATGDYGFFLLSEQVQKDSRRVSKLRKQAPRIVVEEAVTTQTLGSYLRRRRK